MPTSNMRTLVTCFIILMSVIIFCHIMCRPIKFCVLNSLSEKIGSSQIDDKLRLVEKKNKNQSLST